MSNLHLSDISKILDGELNGADVTFDTIDMDTRKLRPGSLFVALEGEQFDGHDFLAQAQASGAVAALVHKKINTDLPIVVVPNTRKALGILAKTWRDRAPIKLLAITGSCGKTTTKSMLASIMSQLGPVLSNPSSFNNDIGLPITVLQLKPEHEYAVLEMGTNHFGEIAYLTEIARPDVALILNIGSAHLEFFGDVAGVARAKGEIFQGLSKDGTAVINADDAFANYLRSLTDGRRVLTFSLIKEADVTGANIVVDAKGYPSFDLTLNKQMVAINLPIVGKHNVANALGAAAAAYAAGATIEQIKAGLETAQPVAKRMIWRTGKNDARILDDTYNAAPNAVIAALNVLANLPGEKVFAFGGMAELGEHGAREHTAVGEKARELGIESIYAVGPLSHLTVQAFGMGGQLFANKSDLIEALKPKLHGDMTLLIKGSRGAKMEDVVTELVNEKG